MDRRPTKRKPKTRKKKWDNPNSDEEPKIDIEEDGMVQNTKNEKTKEIGKEDRREDNCGEELVQCKTYTQQDIGLSEHIDLAMGGIK